MRTIVNILVCALLMLLSLFFPQGHCQNSQSPIAADTLQAEQLAEQARSFAKKSNYDSTIAKFKAAAAIYSRLANEYSEKVFWEKCLENLNQAGYYYWLNLQSAQALRLLDSVVVLVSAHLDTNHFQMAKANHSIGVVYIDSGKFGLSEKALQKALRIYQRTLGKKHKEAGLVYTSLGILYYQRTDYDLSIRNIKEALNIFNGQNEDVRFPIARAHLNLGRAYWRSGDLNEAIVQFTTSVDICEDLYPPNHPQIARTISNLVAVYSEKGDYDTALLYANRGLQIFKENDVNQRSIHAAIVQATNELGDVYRNKRQLETARDYYLESLRLSTQISFPPGRQSWIYMDLGKVEKELGNFKKALEYAETGLEKRLSQYSEDHLYSTEAYILIGNIYNGMDSTENALHNFNKAVKYRQQSLGPKHAYVGVALLEIAHLYFDRQDFKQAMTYAQRAIVALVPDFDEDNVFNNPRESASLSKIDLLNALSLKAEASENLYLENKEVPWLELSLSSAQMALDLYHDLQLTFGAEGSLLDLSQKNRRLFELGARVAMELSEHGNKNEYHKLAYELTARSKNAILLKMIADVKAQKFGQIPDSLVGRELELRKNIVFCETELLKAKQKTSQFDTTRIEDLGTRLFNYKRDHSKLTEILEEKFPEYVKLKYQSKSITLAQLQSVIADSIVIIEYFLGDKDIYAFCIVSDRFIPLKIQRASDFDHHLDQLNTSTHALSPKETFAESSSFLYGQLIRPFEPYLKNRTKIVIIPDGELLRLPFESLCSSTSAEDPPMDFTELPYLIKRFSVNYHYSSALYHKAVVEEKNQKFPIDFIGFAPVFRETNATFLESLTNWISWDLVKNTLDAFRLRDGNSLEELRFSEQEVKQISRLFEPDRAQIFLHDMCSEGRFKTASRNARMVHLATHGIVDGVNPQYSFLAFSQVVDTTDSEDGFLFAGETFNMALAPELLVLSACQTGAGKLAPGEGLMALTRGFLYTGTQNIIASLWKVPDQHTAKLMFAFYQSALSNQYAYADALRAAKLKMISDPKTANPFSWASFILIGK